MYSLKLIRILSLLKFVLKFPGVALTNMGGMESFFPPVGFPRCAQEVGSAKMTTKRKAKNKKRLKSRKVNFSTKKQHIFQSLNGNGHCRQTNFGRFGFQEALRTSFERGTSGDNVVNQPNMFITDFFTVF